MAKNRKNTIPMTMADINRIKLETIQQMMILSTAFIMGEPYINYDEKKILDFWHGMSSYVDEVSKGEENAVIRMNDVIAIINANTGMNLKWNGQNQRRLMTDEFIKKVALLKEE